jgi:hypothetical protein
MHAAAAPTRAQKEALHGCTRAAFTAASASIIIAALSFSWLWPRGKQSQPRYAASYMVITSPQQVGALDASEQRRTEAHRVCARAPRRSRHTDPLFAKMHSHFAWFS